MTASDNAKLALAELTRVWRETPKIERHTLENDPDFIDIASSPNSSVAGIVSYSTLGLCDHDIGLTRVRLELMAAFRSNFEEGPHVLATCAFNAFKGGVPTRPDVIHQGAVAIYQPESPLPHVLLTDPFVWNPGPNILDIPEGKLGWLMIVPISDAERLFAAQHGVPRLTKLFEERRIDILNPERASVI
jgi:hypothetical protein